MGVLFAIVGLVFLGFGVIAVVVGAHVGWITGHLVLGVAVLVYAAATSMSQFREFLSGDAARRGVRYGGNVALQTVILAVILGLLAFLANRHPVHWDWTEAGVHSLATATTEILGQIPEEQPVEILAFFQQGSETGVREMLERYAYEGDRVRFRVVDPNRDPSLATRHEIRSNGILIVCAGPCDSASGTARVTEPTEEEITGAIRSVISERKKVYFLTGHGEGSPDDTEARGFSMARDALAAENLEVDTLFLARQQDVPEDAAAVLVAAPERPLQSRELDSLDRYLRGGGSLLVLTDPFVRSNIGDLLREWGVELGDDVIIDQQIHLLFGPQIGVRPLVSSYGSHPITRRMSPNTPTEFHEARSLRAPDGADGDFVKLASTADQSWAETNIELYLRESRVGRDDLDRPGPVEVVVALTFEVEEDGQREGRLVVAGDSDFGRNRFFAEFFNQDFLVNIINWLSGEEAFITIERKLPRASRVLMSPEQFNNFRYLSLFVFPEAILLLGILLWWRRRT